MRTARSFSEVFNGVFNMSVSNAGKVLDVDLSDQSDIPAATVPPQEESLYSLCSEATRLLGLMSTAVSGLYENYLFINDPLRKDVSSHFIPYQEGSDSMLDLTRIGVGDPEVDPGEEQSGSYIDFLNSVEAFRDGMTFGEGKRIYPELVSKIEQIQRKLMEEYTKIRDLDRRGILGNTDKTRRKRVVEYMRPLNDAQKILLKSDLAQPFYFGENAFRPINPRDYVDPKLATNTDVNALKNGLREALAESRQKDAIYMKTVGQRR